MPDLSLRLKIIAGLVPQGAKVCDVGTDHGYLAIYLKCKGIAQSVIATDLNEKPLKRAQENLASAGVSGVSLRLCDGLAGVKQGEADTVIIAGMGGEVIARILEGGAHIVNDGKVTLIMQPTTSPEILREFLCKNGFSIEKEVPVFENGKLYSVIVCSFRNKFADYSEAFYYVGLLTPKTEAGRLYIEKQKKRILSCMAPLEFLDEKRELYLKYKTILDDINQKYIDYGE